MCCCECYQAVYTCSTSGSTQTVEDRQLKTILQSVKRCSFWEVKSKFLFLYGHKAENVCLSEYKKWHTGNLNNDVEERQYEFCFKGLAFVTAVSKSWQESSQFPHYITHCSSNLVRGLKHMPYEERLAGVV